MREQFIEEARARAPHGVNRLRELLQWEILAALHSAEAFREIAFVGGTCLRLLHGLRRFSEDLDFSTRQPREIDAAGWARAIDVHLAGCDLADTEVTTKHERGAVAAVWVKFPGLLKELGAAAVPSQKLGIKLEFDANPPAGAGFERHVVSTPRLMAITAHDLPSLMSGKLHAILARPYTKGRDWYHLIWYLGQKTAPNLDLLQAAMNRKSSRWCKRADEWKAGIAAAAAATKWKEVQRDVAPFLELAEEAKLLDATVLGDLLRVASGTQDAE